MFDFRPNLHDTKFDNHFITAILASQNSGSKAIFYSPRASSLGFQVNILLIKQVAGLLEKRQQKGFLKQKWRDIEHKWYDLKHCQI